MLGLARICVMGIMAFLLTSCVVVEEANGGLGGFLWLAAIASLFSNDPQVKENRGLIFFGLMIFG